MWLTAPNISCRHGFSTRHGGASRGPFKSLNLGGSQDDPGTVALNRRVALAALNLSHGRLSTLKQVHGVMVCKAQAGAQEGDALVTNQKNLTLAVSIADCYPILFYDDVHRVIGAAHAGWRGTLGRVAEAVVTAMVKLGADPENIQAAVGQGISRERFTVGEEVIDQFREKDFPSSCWTRNKIDLIQCNLHVLKQNNILEKNISVMNRCTFEDDFFSFRRDGGVTGRMWGLIALH